MFINQNVILRVGGRKAPKMSAEDFAKLIESKVPAFEEKYGFIYEFMWQADHRDTKILGQFYKDCEKVEFDFENRDAVERYFKDVEPDYVLPHICMTKSGVPFIPFAAGGDWERPLLVILYWDGKNLRGYVPTKGNVFNTKAMAAFGNNSISELAYEYACDVNDTTVKALEAECISHGVPAKEIARTDEIFLRSQGVIIEDTEEFEDETTLDYESCIADFESRVMPF